MRPGCTLNITGDPADLPTFNELIGRASPAGAPLGMSAWGGALVNRSSLNLPSWASEIARRAIAWGWASNVPGGRWVFLYRTKSRDKCKFSCRYRGAPDSLALNTAPHLNFAASVDALMHTGCVNAQHALCLPPPAASSCRLLHGGWLRAADADAISAGPGKCWDGSRRHGLRPCGSSWSSMMAH